MIKLRRSTPRLLRAGTSDLDYEIKPKRSMSTAPPALAFELSLPLSPCRYGEGFIDLIETRSNSRSPKRICGNVRDTLVHDRREARRYWSKARSEHPRSLNGCAEAPSATACALQRPFAGYVPCPRRRPNTAPPSSLHHGSAARSRP